MQPLNDKVRSLGGHLIFLISQPRSGSTMLQRIIGGHPAIHTLSESWLMLHPVYAMRQGGFEAEYDEKEAFGAVKHFLQSTGNDESEYFKALRLMGLHLYDCALRRSAKNYYLDKTPRYYFIVSELNKIFPKARFIFLLRNPMAVLISLIHAWVKENWFFLQNFRYDLIRAPACILDGIKLLRDRSIIIRYEDVIKDPAKKLEELCEMLAIEFAPQMIHYGQNELPHWPLGDQETVYEHTRPNPQNADRWEKALNHPQIWRLAKDYLDLLGAETIHEMGYDFKYLNSMINTYTPNPLYQKLTLRLNFILSKPHARRNCIERYFKRFVATVTRE